MVEATAPGKIILCGEHAVVYGRPGLAVPVWDVTARASIAVDDTSTDGLVGGCVIVAHDLDKTIDVHDAPADNPLAFAVRAACAEVGLAQLPNWRIDLRSTIPIAGGLGSGAAVSAALMRAVFAQAGREVGDERLSELVYEVECLHHGTPSGIDNTVIAYGAPVWFVKGEKPKPFTPRLRFTLVIADSGVLGPTRETVSDVRRGWQADTKQFDAWFDEIESLVRAARGIIEATEADGALPKLGSLFNQNQQVLAKLGVSSPLLDRLVDCALDAGAFGAKLSGGGRGGNVIALVDESTRDAVANALLAGGAQRVIVTTVG